MSKPDFTGTWKFNHHRSSLQIPAPDATTFVIEHREPRFHLSRTQVAGGISDTFSIDLTTDSRTVVRQHGGFRIRARLCWEDDTLVFDSTLSRSGEHATNLVRYDLADDGRTLIAAEQLRTEQHRHDNTWVFDKQ